MLRLINILWLPLCRINKFGLYFPRRLLRSPILVGHHRLGTVHVPGLRWHDGVHLRLIPKVVPFVFPRSGEDVVLLDDSREVVIVLVWLLGSQLVLMVLRTSHRLRLQGSRDLLSALL
jgi:hypothetical protein